ncbi:MAG: hypothetical protein WAO21_04760, partial [Verrucomicrobiia bacterium]
DGFVFGIQHVSQAQFGDGKNVRLKGFSDKFSAHLCANEVDAGRLISHQICHRSFRPEACGLSIFGFHGNSITWRYQMVCNESITTL